MASRLKSSRVREGAKALQPLALVALVGIVGTVTLLGGCGGGGSFDNNATPSPLIPTPITSPGTTPTPIPTGASPSPGTSPSTSPSPTPSGGGSPTPTPTPTPSMLTLTQALSALRTNAAATISALAVAPDNRWAVTYSVAGATPTDPITYGYYIPFDAPPSLRTKLDSLVASRARIRSITLGAGDTWLITYNQASDSYTDYEYNGIDVNMLTRLVSLRSTQNINVKSAAIGTNPAVWTLIVNQNLNYSQGIPAGLATLLNSYSTNGAITVDHVALGADDTYAVTYNNSQIAGTASGLVGAVNNQGFTISGIGLGLAGTYAVTYNQNQSLVSGATRSR